MVFLTHTKVYLLVFIIKKLKLTKKFNSLLTKLCNNTILKVNYKIQLAL
ncbi:MAG: hypothetical protein K0R02_537 [Rickettsiaceae bacterium]|jgi:hypothetical protein|nr:hypothetical protein [Rickettsiaceae bacterium]